MTNVSEENETQPHGTIVLPWPKPPMSMNARDHWAVKAEKVAAVREAVRLLARPHALRLAQAIGTPVEVELCWEVTDKRRRDVDNAVATLKPAIDGLRDAGILADDNSAVVVKAFCSICRGDRKGLVLIVRPVGG